MRIGLYGGIANNMYVYGKALAAAGVDVCFIRDRSDCYPISQPVWDDLEFQVPYEDIRNAGDWNTGRLTELERGLRWQAPRWLRDPLAQGAVGGVEASPKGLGFLDRRWARRYATTSHRPGVLSLMQQCDALMVCGIEGSVLANASGRPYIIWPHGGDMMIAAGLLQPPLKRVRERLHHALLARQLDAAFRNAICIGNHEPTGITSDFFGAEGYLRTLPIAFMPIPIPVQPRQNEKVRRESFAALLAEMGVEQPDSRLIGFVPSRVDYEWKGQDRLLRALAKKTVFFEQQVHLIFSGWGNHFHEARQFVAENGLERCVTFLDSAISKPLLYRFYLSADFVVDQFVIGMYGTAALEAMACGAPLITWLNDSYDRPWGAPPVIQAKTEGDLDAVLHDIVDGKIDLETTGRDLQSWMARIHDPAAAVRGMMAKYETEKSGRAVRS